MADMRDQRPHLDEVTLCAVDCLNPVLAARAMRISQTHCRFGDALLLTDADVEGPFRRELIPPIRSLQEYSRFILRELQARISTPYVLLVQWDGYVTDGNAWYPGFLACDYVGAKWPWYPKPRVGNGGFSLRSARLLEFCALFQGVPPDWNEDEVICRLAGPVLAAEHGIVFADDDVADRFSYERAPPAGKTFGFHGMFNFCREIEDEDLAEVVSLLHERSLLGREGTECLLMYAKEQRLGPLAMLYERWRRLLTSDEIIGRWASIVGEERANWVLRLAEAAV